VTAGVPLTGPSVSGYLPVVSGETRTMKPIASPARGPSSAGLLLLYADPLDAPSVVRLAESPVIVGREPPPLGLRLNQSAVSRMHARLTRTVDGWSIADLGSHNGTFVDGRRAVGEVVLDDGSVIRIGDALFKFVAQGVEGYAPYAVDGSLPPGARRNGAAATERPERASLRHQLRRGAGESVRE
jgi:pSer/pThr/pTyr-binding forkhead associated (FHA) protein